MVKAIDDYDMFSPTDRLLVAVSGGKESLALWAMLVEAGYQADGLYIGLGIGDYSEDSGGYVRRFANERGLKLNTINLQEDYGYDVPTAAIATKRVPCSACGLSKRRLFDKAATDGGYDAVVTGHNLDDEAAVLFGNTLRWEVDYLARQFPVLQAHDGFPKKCKPLVGSPNERWQRIALFVVSNTSWKSAPSRRAIGIWSTKWHSTPLRKSLQDRSQPFTSTSCRRCGRYWRDSRQQPRAKLASADVVVRLAPEKLALSAVWSRSPVHM